MSRERKRTARLTIDCAENSSTEYSETAVAEGDSLEYFDLVVDPFGEAAGIGAIKRVQD